jgi:cystathionine gamma-synthase
VAYARDDNATWRAFEETVAGLEGGSTGVCFSSGIAAVNAVLALVPPGGVVVAPAHPYSGTRGRLLELERLGRFTVRWVDVTAPGAIDAAAVGAHLVMLESPTNPLMEVCDLAAACASARRHGALSVVDNTFATPAGQRPLTLGADLVLHSGTKFLAGHSDVLIGIVVVREGADDLTTALRTERALGGAISGPFEAYLALRGLRTLVVRSDRASANALELATRLREHPSVVGVRYPGLADDPGHAVARGQMSSFGAMLGVLINGDAERTESVCQRVRLWTHATSLGGVESLIERRARWPFEHPDLPANHLRLSVGIEDVDDLWNDLVQALSG